jgi:hypothetical protein
MELRRAIEAIEHARRRPLVILAATNLDIELLPALQERLGEARTESRDVLLYCRGGNAGAARRIAMLLHDSTDWLAFLVPDRCESAGTILALAGREILAAPTAVFSPVDPQLETGSPEAPSPGAIAAEDLRLFGEMAQRWFGVDPVDAGPKALSILGGSIFPTTLTAFYRSTLEVEAICNELLAFGLPETMDETRQAAIEKLLRGHYSHGFPLAPSDLAAIGLPIRSNAGLGTAMRAIGTALRDGIGPRARRSEEEGWIDAVVMTRDGMAQRRRAPGVPGPWWEAGETE